VWVSIGLIAFVTLLTYGVLIFQLGFYRDDWYQLWTFQAQGPAGLVALFQSDRPLVGYLYALVYQLIGTTPLGWHIYALIIRLVGNLAFFWLVRGFWPERRVETTALALLFSVYPGFASQPNAGVYVSLLLANAAAVLSFALTVSAIRVVQVNLKIIYTILALLLALLYLGIFEAMIGLEAARFIMVWYLLWQIGITDRKTSLVQTLKFDAPYLVLAVAFLYWRLFIFQSTRHATNLGFLVGNLSALPLRSIVSIVVETVKDVFETTFFAWVVPFYQFTATANYRDLTLAIITALPVAIGIGLYLWKAPCGDDEPFDPAQDRPDSAKKGNLHLIWLGAFMVLVIFLPFNVAGRNVLFSGQWDRYALPGALGVAFVIGGILFQYFPRTVRNGLLVALISMSVVVHFFSAAWYRDFWTFQREVWWQMIWRAPALKSGTMLFIPSAPYAEGYEIYGPANAIYFPGDDTVPIGAEVLNTETATNIQLKKDHQHYDRSTLVADHYETPLISIFPTSSSCLHLLDGRKVELPGLIDNTLVSAVANYSLIDQIEVSRPPVSAPAFLGTEPPHHWCYYFQKMSLARQQGNWDEVARLADEAQGQDITPEDISEWMPILEAYATLGRDPEARHIGTIIRNSDIVKHFLCTEMQKPPAYPAPYAYDSVEAIVCGESK
jgi:hypothetical protein